MAKRDKADVVEDVVDEEPALAAPQPFAAPGVFAPAAPPVPKAADAHPAPHGWLVKHPSFGALRVRPGEAVDEAAAKEVYRQTKCPHLPADMLERSGMRIAAPAFVPAATERGK